MAELDFDSLPARRGGAIDFDALPSRLPAQRGAILPISRDAQGNVGFDAQAGLLGALLRAVTLPGDVMAGKVDPLSDEGIDRAAEMATVVSPANPGVRAGDRAIPGPRMAMRRDRVKPPTAEQLKSEATRGYQGVRESGVDYTGDSVRDLAQAARQELNQEGLFAPLTPKTNRLLRGIENPAPDQFAPISQVAAARKAFGRVRKSPEYPEDMAASQRVRQRIADFIVEPSAASLVDRTPAGVEKARRAGRLQRESDGNYAAAKRSETLSSLIGESELRAKAANSGQNLDNATRQRLVSLLLNERRNAGFTAPEKASIERVVSGTGSANFLRGTGNILGGGGGLGALLTGAIGGGAGAAMGGPGGAMIGTAVLPALGAGMKQGAAAMTRRGLLKVDEQTRKRSPLYEQMLQEAPVNPIDAGRRAALIRALLLAEQQQQ